tara:strand:- start:92 stop:985 length:894 start_codon:yes stop_codon:yes gene_type:complete
MNKMLSRFPLFELSYETVKHSKVPNIKNHVYIAIPFGKKFFVWFTFYQDKNICLLLELDKYKQEYSIKEIYPVSSSFDSTLSLGTILYGTIIIDNGIKIFVADNIYYYKGKNVSQYDFSKKITMLSLFFKNDIQQCIYHKSQLLFMLPYMCDTLSEYTSYLDTVNYRIYTTQIRSIVKYGVFNNYSDRSIYECKERIMAVKATIHPDIYNLYNKNDNTFIGNACINSYKTSVFLNSIFRTIKENINLDDLELSDTEDEFENIDEDKYVDLNKQVYMVCKYNSRFKSWEPKTITNTSC